MPFWAEPAAAVLRQAWRWWTGELAPLIPLRLSATRLPQVTIRLQPAAVIIERIADGIGEQLIDPVRIEDLEPASWADLTAALTGARSRIVLCPPDCFSTSVTLPKAARGRLAGAIAMQMGEIAPLEPEWLIWRHHDVRVDGERLHASVTMVRRDRVDQLTALFAEHGLGLPPIEVETGDSGVRLTGGPATRGIDRRWWLAGLLVASIPVTTLVAASVLGVVITDHGDELMAVVAPRVAHDRAARTAERLRAALAPLVAVPSATAILADLAARLPASVSVHSLERRSDGGIDLVVEADDPVVAQDALASDPLLPRLRLHDEAAIADGRTRSHYLSMRP